MRFAAIRRTKLSPRTSAAEWVRRLVSGQASIRPQPTAAPLRREELPADLDQRVRLVGEW